jgi:hypothetical protein
VRIFGIMPTLDVSELNIVIAILGMLINISKVAAANHTVAGAFIVCYGFLSVKIKQVWYLGEACMLSVIWIFQISAHSV